MARTPSHRRLAVTTLVIGSALAVSLWGVGAVSQTAVAAPAPAGSLGQNIAGVWLTDPKPPPPWGGPGYRVITTFHADGTVEWIWSWENGPFGLPETSSVHGTWVQTGDFEITTHELGFAYTPASVLQFFWRFKNVYTFDPGLNTFTLELTEEFLLPDQDPTNYDEVPHHSQFEIFTAKRLDPPV